MTQRALRRTRSVGGGASWEIVVLAVAAVVAAPIVWVVGSVASPYGEVWAHLASTVLVDYVRNSATLLVGVATGTLVMGVTSAWLVSMTRFPGRRIVEVASILPMAIPAYVLAYAYTDVLQFAGPVQSTLRAWTGWGARDYWFPQIRSVGGAIAMLSLALYPYVYLLARTAFREQSTSVIEASRSLGRGAWASFFVVALPLARPAIAAGVALAAMETLADFGTVEYFGVVTFTTGIYRTWFGLGEPLAATQLAAMLLGFVALALAAERAVARRPSDAPLTGRFRSLPAYPLRGLRAGAALAATSLPIVLGFVVPVAVLVDMSFASGGSGFGSFVGYLGNTVTVALVTAAVTVAVALVLAYGRRLRPRRTVRAWVRVASLGYAVPGSVIAVGVVMQLGWLDGRIDAAATSLRGVGTGLTLSGTLVGLIFAYLVRFLAVAHGGVEAGLQKITRSMDDAARSLGRRGVPVLWTVHLPLLRGSLATAALLVFVEVAKELPATLIVRPFDFDTLAVRVYRLAADERLVDAAPGALAIGMVGLVGVLLLAVSTFGVRERGRDER